MNGSVAIFTFLALAAWSTSVAAGDAPKITLIGGPQPLELAPHQCSIDDIPDSAARLLRGADSKLYFYASHYVTRRLVGSSFDDLKKDCNLVFRGKDSPEAGDFDAKAWITSTWTENGIDILAIIHNEYQAHRFTGKCAFRSYLECWYSFLTLAISHDGGRTFERLSRKGPIAAIAEPAASNEGRPRGFFAASNMISREGYVYFISMTTGAKAQPRGSCLFRAKDPFKEDLWEVLTEHGFAPSLSNIYDGITPPVCRRLENLHGDMLSIVRHEKSGLYLAVSLMPGGPHKGKLAASFSPDLISWSKPEPFAEIPSVFSEGCQKERYTYTVLLDPSSRTRNFETVGDSAYLVMIHNKIGSCKTLYDRKIVKWRLAIQ